MGLLRSPSGCGESAQGLHLSQGQQAWGHGLGRLFRDLPDALQDEIEAGGPELVERLRILDAHYIPTRYPDSLAGGSPSDHWSRSSCTSGSLNSCSTPDQPQKRGCLDGTPLSDRCPPWAGVLPDQTLRL